MNKKLLLLMACVSCISLYGGESSGSAPNIQPPVQLPAADIDNLLASLNLLQNNVMQSINQHCNPSSHGRNPTNDGINDWNPNWVQSRVGSKEEEEAKYLSSNARMIDAQRLILESDNKKSAEILSFNKLVLIAQIAQSLIGSKALLAQLEHENEPFWKVMMRPQNVINTLIAFGPPVLTGIAYWYNGQSKFDAEQREQQAQIAQLTVNQKTILLKRNIRQLTHEEIMCSITEKAGATVVGIATIITRLDNKRASGEEWTEAEKIQHQNAITNRDVLVAQIKKTAQTAAISAAA